ncbi:MAG: HEPN domain-containing protein [Candidatus Omnitrophica bacterium]|nr:HEPN domain-containing protein [Candidatus Omnitrophota bacterium]
MKEETKRLLDKSSHSIRAAEILLKEGELDFSASRSYYAMFYVAEALLCEKGFRRSKKHTHVHAAFGENFAKPAILPVKFHRWLIEAFNARVKGDYEADFTATTQDAANVLQQAREFLETSRQYLSQSGSK